MHREYPHLLFQGRNWEFSPNSLLVAGQCEAYVDAVNNTPILPHYYESLKQIALRKGAQATTAIEGNTLSDEEIRRIFEENAKMPPSREYQEIEVRNIYDAFNELLREVVDGERESFVELDLLKRFHKMVGKDLGDHFAAIPGQLRTADVTVGPYRCPDYRDVPELLDRFCEWLKAEFQFGEKKQSFLEIVQQAIVAHVYFEWIHPFGDGNGRTGRLIEFYILLRGGLPNLSLHILSNHYNLTRTEYYRLLEKARRDNDLSEFIEYALVGFRDGLKNTLAVIQKSQFENTWRTLIFEKFDEVRDTMNEPTFQRQRTLALNLPIDKPFTVLDIPNLSIQLARLYPDLSERTITRDIEKLVELNLVKKDGKNLKANTDSILIALRRKKIE